MRTFRPFVERLERQLRVLRCYALFTYPFACVPFLYLWFQGHGLDQAAYGEVIFAYYFAMFVAEVPTGALADRYGPKAMLAAGPLLLACGFGLLLLWPTYEGFLAGEALLGVGHASLSGAPASLLYETLREHGQQHRYLAEESRIHALRLLGTGGSFLAGGFLVRFGGQDSGAFAATIALTCLLHLVAFAAAMLLRPEPGAPTPRWRDLGRRMLEDLALPAVRWLLAYWVVLFALLRYPFHNYQPYLDEAKSSEPLFGDQLFVGVLYAALNFVAAPLSGMVPWLAARFGRAALFWAMPMALAASFAVMAYERSFAESGEGTRALAWLGVSMFLVQQVPFAMHWALVQEFVNHRIRPEARTSVLSALSLAARACFAGLSIALFGAQEAHGMATALAWAAAIGFAAAVLVLLVRPRGLLEPPA